MYIGMREILAGQDASSDKHLIELVNPEKLVAYLSELVGKEVVVSHKVGLKSKLQFRTGAIRAVEPNHLWYDNGGFATGMSYICNIVAVKDMNDIDIDLDSLNIYNFRGLNGDTDYHRSVIHSNPFQAFNAINSGGFVPYEMFLKSTHKLVPGYVFAKEQNFG